MLGVSFSEIVVIAVVTLIVVGPRRLPEMLGTLGKWIGRLRQMTTEVRRQTGIDEILREEGVMGGISELRSMLRGELANVQRYGYEPLPRMKPESVVDTYGEPVLFDRGREYPVEGPDAYGAIPEDLVASPPAAIVDPNAPGLPPPPPDEPVLPPPNELR